MEKLVSYLRALPNCRDVHAVRVTMARIQAGQQLTYEGAQYVDTDDQPRLFLLGDLPKHKLRRPHTCYVIDGIDWYVACFMSSERLAMRIAGRPEDFHPFGPTFILLPWSLPEPIDKWKPYDRVPTIIQQWPGIFRYHSCAYCEDGKLPCRQGHPNRCDNPHARND
jgi:hypothetical protein